MIKVRDVTASRDTLIYLEQRSSSVMVRAEREGEDGARTAKCIVEIFEGGIKRHEVAGGVGITVEELSGMVKLLR